MKSRCVFTLLLLALGLILAGGLVAALMEPALIQDVIAGGGGGSGSQGIALVDTVGQPIVGASSAGGVHLQSGFWAGAQIEPPVPPTPTRTPTPEGVIRLPLLLSSG